MATCVAGASSTTRVATATTTTTATTRPEATMATGVAAQGGVAVATTAASATPTTATTTGTARGRQSGVGTGARPMGVAAKAATVVAAGTVAAAVRARSTCHHRRRPSLLGVQLRRRHQHRPSAAVARAGRRARCATGLRRGVCVCVLTMLVLCVPPTAEASWLLQPVCAPRRLIQYAARWLRWLPMLRV